MDLVIELPANNKSAVGSYFEVELVTAVGSCFEVELVNGSSQTAAAPQVGWDAGAVEEQLDVVRQELTAGYLCLKRSQSFWDQRQVG